MPSVSTVYEATSSSDIKKALERIADPSYKQSDRGLVTRGLGRSYGDPAQNAGGSVIDLSRFNQIYTVDRETGIMVMDAGVSLDYLMRVALPFGLWVLLRRGI